VTTTTAALLGLALAWAAPFVGLPRWMGGMAAVGVLWPAAGLILAAGTVLATVLRRVSAARSAAKRAADDVVLLADLTALGVGAGLGLTEALRSSARWVSPQLAAELGRVLRAVRRGGTAALLDVAAGGAAPLYRAIAAAASSGAPLVGVVEAFAAERRHAEHSARVEAARRLPVRLLLPLALLILPGFVVLAVGPALLDSLARLDPAL
jgi:hypothetical protein